ncbi:hypothetical protein ASE31_29495 [Acidovorax sp. Root217]|nr:hypothetical protein ASE31_29495 [Acidovorax sp. Root217]
MIFRLLLCCIDLCDLHKGLIEIFVNIQPLSILNEAERQISQHQLYMLLPFHRCLSLINSNEESWQICQAYQPVLKRLIEHVPD